MAPTLAIVNTPEGDFEFQVQKSTTGKELMDMVLAQLSMPANPLYGLQYTDHKEHQAFLEMDKKVLSQDVEVKDGKLEFLFSAKYYPESVNDELTTPVMQRIFWKQIQKAIAADVIYSPGELCVLFAAQTQQARHGDFDEARHGAKGFLAVTEELPPRVLDQHALTDAEWEDRIKNAWRKLAGTPREAAIMDYLNIAQDLEQFGITYFEITNKKGTKLWLGVHSFGMDIYEANNKVTPRIGFPWAEIRNIAFNDKKFTIKMAGKDAPDFKFYSPRYKLNKRILALCVGNHVLFVDRRRSQAAGTGFHEDRATLEKKLKQTKEQLLAIRADLERTLDKSKLSSADVAHEVNEKAGLDKFKTMKKAQSGDAKNRVSDFENLEDTEC